MRLLRRSKKRETRKGHFISSLFSVFILIALVENVYFGLFHIGTTTIVAQSGPGRLGNQLFQYISTLGISHANGVAFCVSTEHPFPFDDIFQGPFPPCPARLPPVTFLPELGYGLYTKFRFPSYCLLFSCYISLGPYLQSFKYLDVDVRRTLEFLPTIQDKATQIFHQLRPNPTTLMIGIHVRRGDVATTSVDYLQVAPASYFAKAMDYFHQTYPTRNIQFVVSSDDIPWCQRQEIFGHAVMMHSIPAIDLAFLSLCDHIIMSVGTFGWFAGMFAGGDVVYYKDAIVLDHPTNKGQISVEDFYPSSWIAIS